MNEIIEKLRTFENAKDWLDGFRESTANKLRSLRIKNSYVTITINSICLKLMQDSMEVIVDFYEREFEQYRFYCCIPFEYVEQNEEIEEYIFEKMQEHYPELLMSAKDALIFSHKQKIEEYENEIDELKSKIEQEKIMLALAESRK